MRCLGYGWSCYRTIDQTTNWQSGPLTQNKHTIKPSPTTPQWHKTVIFQITRCNPVEVLLLFWNCVCHAFVSVIVTSSTYSGHRFSDSNFWHFVWNKDGYCLVQYIFCHTWNSYYFNGQHKSTLIDHNSKIRTVGVSNTVERAFLLLVKGDISLANYQKWSSKSKSFSVNCSDSTWS